jgi:hypothetical protein
MKSFPPNTSPRQKIQLALEGDRPDGVPIYPIYDLGYLARCAGQDERAWHTASAAERLAMIEKGFRRHDVDGFFVHPGTTDEFVEAHRIEVLDSCWLITNRSTGEQYRLLSDGRRVQANGEAYPPAMDGRNRIQTEADIERRAAPVLAENDPRMLARYAPLNYLAARYPRHHFGFQLNTPMVRAVGTCGGYVEGLTLMAEDRPLFRKLLERCLQNELSNLAAACRSGASSVWFTSYYTGADTISPRDYAELVFPYDLEVCRAAKAAGLYVLNWYLGDLMPNLGQVLQLPLDALVLEQGRKGYTTDPVEIRKQIGPKRCIFAYGFEYDFCTDRRDALASELRRQYEGAGRDGAFIAGTPIMPSNASPDAVDFYFAEARRLE